MILKCELLAGQEEQYYNSLLMVDPSGALCVTYKKHFLYEQDEHWALEGPSFVSLPLPPFGTLGFGMSYHQYRCS
jgi:predicted amidohydrolase